MPQQARAHATYNRILAAAVAEFGDKGYAGASVNTILEGSGLTKGAMYFHFTSKDGLAQAVLDAARDTFQQTADRRLADTDTPAVDALAGLLRDAAHLYETDPTMWAEFRLSFDLDAHDGSTLEILEKSATALLERATGDGSTTANADAAALAHTLTAALAGQLYRHNPHRPELAASFPRVLAAILHPQSTLRLAV